ncbi:MAG: hypothetical protein ACK5Y8_04895 [Betaproteobacteria bacterium]|jgi:hypothetical protein|nr:hypothetical protein [Rubrivivax sp.]
MAETTTPIEAGVTLGTPLLDDAIRDIHFFNGRLLTGRDLQREQEARRLADWRVGAAVGPGIAWGLEVSVAGGSARDEVTVTGGLGVTLSGQVLHLATSPTLKLVAPPPVATSAVVEGFGPCKPLGTGGYAAGAGLFVLTLAPVTVAEGKAPVLALDAVNTRCSTDAQVEAVQFRLLRITDAALDPSRFDVASAAGLAHYRNAAAHACFAAEAQAAADAGLGQPKRTGPLASAQLSDCELPLALVYMQGAEIGFVDAWAVRRRRAAGASTPIWKAWLGERALALGEARMAQFQAQTEGAAGAAVLAAAANQTLGWLPPAGFLPATLGDAAWKRFLGTRAPARALALPAAHVAELLGNALRGDAVELSSTTDTAPFRVYRVGGSTGPLLFVRDTRRADQVWLDGARARLPGVTDVQAAIEQLQAGNCRHVVVPTGMSGVELERLASSLVGQDVTLCFEPGRHVWPQPLRLAGLRRLRVQGVGAQLVNEKGACALRIVDCDWAEVRDIELQGEQVNVSQLEKGQNFEGALTVLDTPQLAIEGVRATCALESSTVYPAVWVAIEKPELQKAGGTRVTVSDCHFHVGPGQQALGVLWAEVTRICRNHVLPLGGASAGRIGYYVQGVAGGVLQVQDNVLRGVAAGMELLLAAVGETGAAPSAGGRIGVEGNRIELDMSGWPPQLERRVFEPHAISVRGVRTATVSANQVVAVAEEADKLKVVAISLFGNWGLQLLVRDNFFSGCPVGVEFKPAGTPKYFVWAFQCNLAVDDKTIVLSLPPDERIVEEHNEPKVMREGK